MQGLSEQTGEGAACIVTWHGGITEESPWRILLGLQYGNLSACTPPSLHFQHILWLWAFHHFKHERLASYQTLLSAFLRLSIKHLTYVLENPLTLSHKKTQEKTNSQRSPGSLESSDRNRDRADRSGAASGSVRSGMSMDAWPFPQGLLKSRWAWKLLKPRKRAEDIQNDYSST